MVNCPICGRSVKQANINNHIDSNCVEDIEHDNASTPVASFFKTPAKRDAATAFFSSSQPVGQSPSELRSNSLKRSFDVASSSQPHAAASLVRRSEETHLANGVVHGDTGAGGAAVPALPPPVAKKAKTSSAFEKAAPLAERMRPKSLDDVCGQELVGPDGVLRGLIEQDRVPSMILWGGAGTGKTTIARVIASMVGSRFVEINSTSSGVAECKKIFAEAKNELGLTGRKTIFFCDEIHRFSKSQQDVFLGPVEAGHVTLIGATTENPSFKVQNALLSRCRTFTLQKLTDKDIGDILLRALEAERHNYNPSPLVNNDLIEYLAAFADGDARTALNLLELAMELSQRANMTLEMLKQSLTKTLVYDRAGDQHYDTISAFHKSVRGSDADAALYYLARMIQSGEDALYIARRMIVIASEDVGLADNTLLPLATAAYTAAEKVGMPEARINLAHVTVALCQAKKSTRVYRGLSNAIRALEEPGIAGLPIPIHLRNAPTRLMKELGYGKEYKYNPDYVDGKVKQEYLPEKLNGRTFLEDRDLGEEVDPDLLEE
jgi:putative ATPase